MQTALLQANQSTEQPETPDLPRMVLKKQKVYTFVRHINLANIATTASDTSGSYVFSLSSLPGYTDFTSLFDQYRIVQVTVCFSPINQTAVGAPIITAIDYDDNNTPVSADDLRQYDTSRTCVATRYFERTLSPRAAIAAYSGSAFTAYASSPENLWIDMASPGIPYYGLKYYWTGRTGATAGYQVDARFVLQFRHPF